jgi:hypothetical protein
MNSALTAIIIAVGGTSLICILVSQIQNRRVRGRSGSSAGSDGGYYAGDDDGSHLFGGSDTAHGGSDHSTGPDNPGDSGGSDSGAGDSGAGDSGAGDGGEAATAVAAAAIRLTPVGFYQDRYCRCIIPEVF